MVVTTRQNFIITLCPAEWNLRAIRPLSSNRRDRVQRAMRWRRRRRTHRETGNERRRRDWSNRCASRFGARVVGVKSTVSPPPLPMPTATDRSRTTRHLHSVRQPPPAAVIVSRVAVPSSPQSLSAVVVRTFSYAPPPPSACQSLARGLIATPYLK